VEPAERHDSKLRQVLMLEREAEVCGAKGRRRAMDIKADPERIGSLDLPALDL
jgi:hypothetical protein